MNYYWYVPVVEVGQVAFLVRAASVCPCEMILITTWGVLKCRERPTWSAQNFGLYILRGGCAAVCARGGALLWAYFLGQTVNILFVKSVFFHIGFSYTQNWIVSKLIFKKKNEAMSKGYFLDETLTIFKIISSLDFPVFKIGLFQNGFSKKKWGHE